MIAAPSPRPADALRPNRVLPLLLLACLTYSVWIATQWIAYRLGYARVLGPWAYRVPAEMVRWWRVGAALLVGVAVVSALLARRYRPAPVLCVAALLGAATMLVVSLGPVYTPQSGLAWLVRFRRVAQIASVLQEGVWAFGGTLIATMMLLLVARPRRLPRTPTTSHGSAAWGSGRDLLAPAGLMLGRALTPDPRGRRSTAPILRYRGDGHVLTVAPTRSGKGVGCVVPNLLTYPGSVLVTDPKGENVAITARARRSLGQVVHAIDPFDAVGGTAAFNPLDLVDPRSADAVDDARLLADMLVVSESKSGGDHVFWNEEARGLLSGLILHVAASAPAELRTLSYVRELLTLPPKRFAHLLREMLESDAVGGLVSRAAARLRQKAEKERSGVVSTAQSHTHFLDSPRMARTMGASTFRLEDLKRDRVSVFLVLPPERMDGYHRWLRLMIASSLLAMTRTPGEPAERVLFLLDEFAHLGRMQPVERDVGLVGGYGVTFWLLVQDLSQLRGTYPEKWQTFLANCDVLQAFGTSDWETAEYLSKMTGETTILVESENRSAGVSRGRHGQRQESAAVTLAEKGRRLLTPDEVLRLPPAEELLFVRGRAPVRARRMSYLVDPELVALADPNPMHARVGTGNRSVSVTGPPFRAAL